MMINEDNAKDLLIRYGVREGVVKIPLILMINRRRGESDVDR